MPPPPICLFSRLNHFSYGSHSEPLIILFALFWTFSSLLYPFFQTRGQNNAHYLRCGWTMAVESDEVIFVLISIPFLIIPNIRFAFFLVASEPWADVFIQGSLLSSNSQLRAYHFIMNLGLFFPTCIALCLYTLNFICHFIAQSLSLIRTFCNSSPFTIPLLKTNRKPVAPFSQERLAGSEQCRETHLCAKSSGWAAVTLPSGQTGHSQGAWARACRQTRRLPSALPQMRCSLCLNRAWKHGSMSMGRSKAGLACTAAHVAWELDWLWYSHTSANVSS